MSQLSAVAAAFKAMGFEDIEDGVDYVTVKDMAVQALFTNDPDNDDSLVLGIYDAELNLSFFANEDDSISMEWGLGVSQAVFYALQAFEVV